MDLKSLQEQLKLKYTQDNWKKWLKDIFGSQIQFELQHQTIDVSKGKAKEIERFATIALSDNKNIAVLDILTSKEIQIARNRVALREIGFDMIDQHIYHGLLVFYHSEDKNQLDYRLSFISKQTIIDEDGNFSEKSTNPKRYSFILGDNESCYTPAQRLVNLKSKISPFIAFENNVGISLKDLTDTFSVEALNNEFFKKYKDIHYKRIWEYIANKEEYAKHLLNYEESELVKQQKPIRDFAKKLLGRIVFLYFVQKKGWMGCPVENKDWVDGDKQFVKHLFKDYPNKEHFYSQALTTLFFNVLNTKRHNDKGNDLIPESLHYVSPIKKSLIGYKAPFLNGGLFDDDQKETNKFDFPVEYFEDLFEFFSQYNFTIDENSPDEQEVGIDPEMLGHIFENLLEENKDKGAFYTPKEIVHHMCQESLIQYLCSHLRECEDDESPCTKAIENFIRKSDEGDRSDKNNFIVANASRIKKLLDNVKICDPAIGSGAFPMGMLQVIFEAKCILNIALTNSEKARLKKEIIQKSIYGVDLEPGAVDIARLRFWLSLVVDEDEPQPLPNLDYKIMQGNSLLERIEDVDLSSLFAEETKEDETIVGANGQMILGGGFDIVSDSLAFEKYEKDEFLSLVDMYFDFEVTKNGKFKTKQEVKHRVNTLIEGKLKAKFEKDRNDFIDGLAIKKSHLQSNEIKATDPVGIATKKEKTAEKLRKEIEVLERKITDLSLLLDKISRWENEDKERPYFLWHTYFKDVFDKGGFDIVIGNPPYIQLQKMGKDADALQKANYETFSRTGDIYCLFYEQGIKLLKENGVLAYITSNTWMRTKFGESMRKFFREQTQTVSLLNFEDTKIFQTATVETNILISKSRTQSKPFKAVAVKSDYSLGTNIYEYFQKNAIEIKETSDEGWIILNKEDFFIKKEIEQNGLVLRDWNDVEMNFALKSGFNDAFFIDDKKRNELIAEDPNSIKVIKPLLRGRNISKYSYLFDNIYILFIPWHFPIKEDVNGASLEAEIEFEKQYPAVYNHLKSFKDQLSKRNTAETGIRYEWYALQRASSTFAQNYEKEKIVWLAITDKPAFALDKNKIYVTSPSYIMVADKLKYHLCFLNSKVVEWYLDKVSSSTGQGTNQWTKVFMDQIPIPKIPNQYILIKFEILADYLIYLNDINQPNINPYADNESISPVFEDVANMMVYEMYFNQHMKELDIDVLQFIVTETYFKPIDNLSNPEDKKDILAACYKWLQESSNPIRNRIILSNIKSKDIIRRINSTTH
jgi:hypothetical protein